jgi:hypothetical protein
VGFCCVSSIVDPLGAIMVVGALQAIKVVFFLCFQHFKSTRDYVMVFGAVWTLYDVIFDCF